MSQPSKVATKYTDESYLTPSQVSKDLGLSNYDEFWALVEEYRSENRVSLPFGKIHGIRFYVTLTEPIRIKINQFQNKIKDFLNLSRNVYLSEGKEAKVALLMPLLKEAAIIEKSSVNELSIKMMINALYDDTNSNGTSVSNYCNSLNYYLDASPLEPNEDFLAGAYQRVLGQEELVDFYRFSDFDAQVKRLAYIANPDYPYAPYGMIEDLMSVFAYWLENDQILPFFAKAVIAQYYLNYIKPFSEKNGLMASLLAKDIAASRTSLKESFILPFESLILDEKANTEPAREAKAKGDMTYLIFQAMSCFDPYIDSMLEQLRNVRVSNYKEEFSSLSEEEEKIADSLEKNNAIKEPTQLSFLLDDEKEEKTENASENVEIEKRQVQEATPMAQHLASASNETPIKKVENLSSDTQISAETLSKSEIKDYIRYLLESNPSLNKKQASFLANHCTPGRYYTIQQFKEYANCVYETARTSMDKLASEGYYDKLQFKNKFVYSPKKKGQ